MASEQAADSLKAYAAYFPPLVHDLIRTLGWNLCMALINAYGGCSIHVPSSGHNMEAHYLFAVLGPAGLKALIKDFSGEDLVLPKVYRGMLAARNDRMKAARKSGFSIRQLALEHNLTERQVYSILGNDLQDDRQLNLFD